ncbi:bacitracin ABC transporter [Paenibacillus sp. 1011MAR3C5]|uniref:ABC transporter permease n=1 Tax=Paenibacillus sp. 1011MAR3C5 TaxID=1675787 RepID=UPI000E6D4679|nr:ABC transporter permease [Paenibacillus sp. 1011MAR3C5]RJE86344.1 bacitracin ABC transporter [Paenibacillus sp. 1011MAR3C5]
MGISSIIYCEARKIWLSNVFWVVLAIFTLMPLMIGFVTYSDSSSADWDSYLTDLLGSISALLVIGFSFTASWVFGREYTDKTIKEVLLKPVSKLYTVSSKFIVIIIWDVLLVIFSFLVVAITGAFIGISDGSISLLINSFFTLISTSLLIVAVSTTSALLANVSKGYLAPIGLAFIIVILSSLVVQLGIAAYFPWTIPALFLKNGTLGFSSIIVIASTGIAGFAGTVAWWRFAEQQ